MSEHIQTSLGSITSEPAPGKSVGVVRADAAPRNRLWQRLLFGLVLFALAYFLLLPPGASLWTFSYIRPGMSRWLVEYIVGRPGYFNQPEFADYEAVWRGFRPPPAGAAEVSHWLTDSVAGVVSYDVNERVLDVECRDRRFVPKVNPPARMRPRSGQLTIGAD
jgi:hypothetical protein